MDGDSPLTPPTPQPGSRTAGPADVLPRIEFDPAVEHPCAHVSAREASYLMALCHLQETMPEPTQIALARAMEVTAPTALEMVRRLRASELIATDRLTLTPLGISAVLKLASRRYAAMLLTHDLLGLDPESAAAEAERLAPSLSAELTRRLLEGRGARE